MLTVKDLIKILLEEDMDAGVVIQCEGPQWILCDGIWKAEGADIVQLVPDCVLIQK